MAEEVEMKSNGGYTNVVTDVTEPAGDNRTEDMNMNIDSKDDDDEEMYFLVINIGEGKGFEPILGHTLRQIESAGKTGDIEAIAEGLKHLVRPQSDPYVQVMIDDDDSNHMLQTHVIWDSDDGLPKWTKFGRFYLDINNLPNTITIEAFDKSEEPEIEDAKYGEFVVDTAVEGIFDTEGKIWHKQCKMGESYVIKVL